MPPLEVSNYASTQIREALARLPGVGQVEANVLLTEEARPGPLG